MLLHIFWCFAVFMLVNTIGGFMFGIERFNSFARTVHNHCQEYATQTSRLRNSKSWTSPADQGWWYHCFSLSQLSQLLVILTLDDLSIYSVWGYTVCIKTCTIDFAALSHMMKQSAEESSLPQLKYCVLSEVSLCNYLVFLFAMSHFGCSSQLKTSTDCAGVWSTRAFGETKWCLLPKLVIMESLETSEYPCMTSCPTLLIYILFLCLEQQKHNSRVGLWWWFFLRYRWRALWR